MKRGVFITLEGIDGTGKSTQLRLLSKHLRAQGYAVILTREPGGTRTGEAIRRLLLASRTGKLSPLAELALMYAARAQHLEEVVRPALATGQVVLSDRFSDASLAYQGYGRKLGAEIVRALDRIVCGKTQPDLTILLDLEPRKALARTRRRSATALARGARFESEGLKFHARVRAGYRAIARREPRRVKVIKTDRRVREVEAEIRSLVEQVLARRSKALAQK